MGTGEREQTSRRPALSPAPPAADFESFYRHEYAPVVRLALVLNGRYDIAQDIAQDAFLAAHRHWDRVATYENPAAWVRRVVTNRSISRIRKTANEMRSIARLVRRPAEPVEASIPDPELWAAVRSLPGRQAQVLALMFVEDLSASDVAKVLGCGEETIRTHARRGRQSLADLLGPIRSEGQ